MEVVVMGELITPVFDTPSDAAVSISLDIGIIPAGYPGAGKYVITIQAHPLPTRREADVIAAALREAINSRLGIRMEATH
jgi:hypothetical protein